MPSVFQITELSLLITSLLDSQSYKVCTIVCKTWHQAFQPLLWQVLKVPTINDDRELVSWQRSVKNNAQYIEHIAFRCSGSLAHKMPALTETLLIHCRSLLEIELPWLAHGSQWMALMKLNPGLERLNARGLATMALEQLGEVLRDHRHLHYLDLSHPSPPALLGILTLCPSLRSLAIVGFSGLSSDALRAGWGRVAERRALALRHLVVNRCDEVPSVVGLLSCLPFLESLDLGSVGRECIQCLAKLFHEGHWLCLTELKVQGACQYTELIEAIPPGQLRSICFDRLDCLGLLLERQGETIETLQLTNYVDYQMLAEAFFKCPRLRKLEVEAYNSEVYLDIRYLLYKPWVCNSLEVLRVALGHTFSDIVPPVLAASMAENQHRPDTLSLWIMAENLFVERMKKLVKPCEICDLSDHREWSALSYKTRRALNFRMLRDSDPDADM